MPILTDEERCGTTIAGKYQVDRIIGRGGMGVVFAGHHTHTQRPVAIKILRPELSQDPTLSRRFVREARAASALRHPNVVEVLDLGLEADGTAYMALELLEGESLADLLERKERLPIDRTLELLLPVMDALRDAHAQRIVHRDLKPDNIFLARQHDGRTKPTLLDFGIAKLIDSPGSFETRTGSVMGTPHYMSPEQARGASEQDAPIDIWAMGVIAFECLTGQLPFDADAPTLVMIEIITGAVPRIDSVVDDVPAPIVEVVARAMQKAPSERHPSMEAFVEALRDAAEASGYAVPRPRESLAGPLTSMPPPEDEQDDEPAMSATRPARGRPRSPELDSQGETVAARPSAGLRPVSAPAPVAAAPPAPPASRAPLWLALAGVTIVAAGVGAWLAFGGDDPPPPAAEVPTVTTSPAASTEAEPTPEPEPAPAEQDDLPVGQLEPEPEPEPTAEARPAPRRARGRRRAPEAPPTEATPAREPRDPNRTPGVVEW